MMSRAGERVRMIVLTTVALGGLLLLSSSMGASVGWTAEKEPQVFSGTLIEDLMTGGSSSKETPDEETSEKAAESDGSNTKTGTAGSRSETKKKAAERSDASAGTDQAKGSGKGKTDGSAARSKDGGTAKKEERNAATLLKDSRALADAGEYSAALSGFRLAFKRASRKDNQKIAAAALHGMALMCHNLGRESDALIHLRRAIKINRTVKNAHARSLDFLLAGRILMAQSRNSLAVKSFEESLKLLPNSEAKKKPQLLEDMATCLIRLNKHSAALETYGKLLALFNKEGNKKEAARIHVTIGELQISRSDFRAARANFKKAESIYRSLKLKKELGETLLRVAYLYNAGGDLQSGLKAMAEARSLLSGDSRTDVDALPLFVHGLNEQNEGHMVQAVNSLTRALNQYRKTGDRVMTARVQLALAKAESDRSRMRPALEHGGRALKEFRILSEPGGEARALHVIATVYFKQGFVQKALEYAQESHAIARKIKDRVSMAEARILLAEMHAGLGDVEFAWKLLKEAQAETTGDLNPRIKGRVRLAVARFRLTRESSSKALQEVEQARKDFLAVKDRRGVADCDHLMGLIYELRGDRKRAFELFQQALKEHRAMWDRYGEGKDLTALGVHQKNLGDHDGAMKYFETALDLQKRIGDRKGYAASMANIGLVLKYRNRTPEALRNLEESLKIYRELGDKKGEADLLTNLANIHAAGRAYSAALDKLNEALALHREIHDIRGVATDLASIGRLYLVRADFDNAGHYLQEAAKINARISNPRGEVAILAEQAMFERAKKNTPKAISLLQRAMKLAQKTGDLRAVSSLNLKMASVLQDSGEYTKALALLQESLENMKQQGDRRGELWALGEIGVIEVKTENYESALRHLQRAVELRTELGLPASQSRDLDFYLGEIHEGFKDYERALDHYHKALAMAQISGTDSMLGRIYDRIGKIYYQIEEYAKAKEFFEDALRVHTETKNVAMQKTELIRLGDISSKLGDSEGALKYQLKALNLTRETDDKKTEARILTRIGSLYQLLGRPRIALDYYQEARAKRSELGDRRGVNENLLQIALVTSILGNFDSAVSNLKQSFEISHCSEDRSMLWKAYFIMGRALQGKNRIGEALESYRKAITILEAREADVIEESDEDEFVFGGKTALFETTLKMLMRLARKDPEGAYDNQALRIVERLKASSFENSLFRTNVENFFDLPKELLIKEKSLKLGLRKLNDRIATQLSSAKPDQRQIEKLIQERREREKVFMQLKERLIKEYPAYAALRYPAPVSVHRLQREIIRPDEAILEYMVTRSHTYVFAIDRQRFYTYSIDYSLKKLSRDVQALVRPLYGAEAQESWDPSVAYRLYANIIKPVEHFIAGKKAVVVIPHGPLSSLPFEILVTSSAHAGKRFWSATDRPHYLVEKYAFCYAPSASMLSYLRERKRERKPGWNLVAFGDAIYSAGGEKRELNPGADRLLSAFNGVSDRTRNQSLRPLPGARKEISEIVKIMGGPVQTYFGAQATETLFKKVDLGRYGYIHLATHGLLLNGAAKLWRQPAIVFSLVGDAENDGFLQLGEVFGLKLNADLVVLSSCLSPGKPEPGNLNGLLGLSRAFLFAGADSVILSMWPVNDESTATLFINMYTKLQEVSKAEALRQAKLALLNNQATSHPYYWAPFVLVGKWNVSFRPGFNKIDPKKMRFKGLSTWRKFLSL